MPKSYTTEPKEWFPCPVQGCPKFFRNIGSRTRHIARHTNDQKSFLQDMLRQPGWTPHPVTQEVTSDQDSDFPPNNFEMPGPSNVPHPSPTASAAAPMTLDDDTFDIRTSPPPFPSSRSPSPSNESVQSTFTEYHPLINGESIKLHHIHFLTYQQYVGAPCNEDGSPLLDPESPPPAIKPRESNDWTPYKDRIAFEAAEFLFKRRKMSQANIDFLCQLWAASLAPHHDVPPFSNHQELHRTIDSTPIGGVPWQSVSFSYDTDGLQPENAPTWMTDEYTIWFRDPRLLFKNMLENPSFADFFDYASHRQFANGTRRYENFMSGDWSWKQAVGHRLVTLNFYN